MRTLLALLLVVIGSHAPETNAQTRADRPTVIQGRVVESGGTGLPYASIRIDGMVIGTATDSTGQFHFTTRRTGAVTLRASMVGYADATRDVMLASGDTLTVRFRLQGKRIPLAEAVITGRYTTGAEAQATLSPLEAVTTPGASGDLFRALQAFPGVAAPGDGAGLFVRGGDVSETQTLLDGAPLIHPYRYESPTGGTFSTIPPFLVKGTQFATGGFSAQYGNALSGVLAIETLDRPEAAQQHVDVGLAGGGLRIDQPLVDDHLGLRVSGNRSFTGLLFRVNGQQDDFDTVPQGWDGTASLTWDHDRLGQIKAQSFARSSRLGVHTQDGAFAGQYRTTATNQLHSLQWTAGAEAWSVQSSLSWSRFASERTFGVLDLRPTDDAATLRIDAEQHGFHRNGRTGRLRAGVLAQRRAHHFFGTVPTQPDVLTPSAPTNTFDETLTARRAGAYLDADVPLTSRLTATVGVRADHQEQAGTVVDPRTALSVRLSESTTLRTAWGIYHQFPEPATMGEHTGPNTLGAQQAQHVVAGLRHERGPWLARLDGYWKPYDDLIVRTGDATYANAGSGHARGVDAFVRYGAFLETPISGWISYSVLDAERTQPRDRGSDVSLEDGPAPFDLTHQLSVVGKAEVLPRIYLGGAYRLTSGRPFTPVQGTTSVPGGSPLPIDGPVGSARLPSYQRLDVQVSYFWPFGSEQHAVLYAAMNNLLDRANAVGVNYTADYSQQTLRTTNFRRSFYVGVSVQL